MSHPSEGREPACPSDEELVREAQRDPDSPRARQAAGVLFGRYHRRVYGWCFRRLHDHERAMDLAQEVLLSAYRSLPAFEGRASFSSWLFTIVRNRGINAARAWQPDVDPEADPDAQESEALGADAELEDRESEARVLDLVRRTLDPVEQEAFWLRTFERWPVDEITRSLDIRTATGARGVLQSARRKLRAALARQTRGI